VVVVSFPVLFPFRSVDTATVRFTAGPHHRRRVTIDHRPLAGVTPPMLLDWFTHLDGTTPMTRSRVAPNRGISTHPRHPRMPGHSGRGRRQSP
jgi:hypothetical protein